MWFHLGCQNFIAKKILKNDYCDVFISDFIHIWHKTLSDNELISICQTLNPLLEASVEKIKDFALKSFEDMNAHKDIQKENSKITLNLESNIIGLKFQFQVSLNQGSSKMFFEEFTLPLLLFIKNFKNRENKLLKIIDDKDEEIAEYRREYGHLKSSFMITKPFIKEEFEGHDLESIPWDLSSFVDSIKFLSTEKLYKVEQVQPILEKEKEKCLKIKDCNKIPTTSKEKSENKKIDSKLRVSFENQIVKKKRNALKLNF